MKKKIQKYLAGEREGFSLVELIIVIAIMAILIGVVTLAVLPNIAKSKESKDITALDSLLSSVNNAVASQQVSSNGSFMAPITNNKADISTATVTPSGDTKVTAVRDEIVKLMGKKEIPFSSSKVCTGSNSLLCQWRFNSSTGEISIETAVVPSTSSAGTVGTAVVGDYMGAFASSNGKPVAGATAAPAP